MRTRSFALSAAPRKRPPYCWRGVAPITARERGLSILCIAVIWLSVQISMPSPSPSHPVLEIVELCRIPPQHFGAFVLRHTLKAPGDIVARLWPGGRSLGKVGFPQDIIDPEIGAGFNS